ncbi:polysaccharide biosynthesis tyrosine autokinase [Thermoleophilia bacterium SCSIO 60948]|nr:polysaccharide biosynthesis tyrosine autokinase [Thermoleophilia bacterium SCSIO 60948]
MERASSATPWFLRALRRRWYVVVAAIIGGLCAAGLISALQAPLYSSEASLLFRDAGFDQQLFGSSVVQARDPSRDAATNVELVSLDVVADRTAADLGSLSGSEVGTSIDINSEGQSDLVTVVATRGSPAEAQELANAFVSNYVRFRRAADRAQVADARRLVENDFDSLSVEDQESEEGQALQEQIGQLSTLEALQTGNSEIVQEADLPDSPATPNVKQNLLLGGVFGLVAGVLLTLLVDRLDRRLRDPEEIASGLNLPLLGIVGSSKYLAQANPQDHLDYADSEAFRLIRTRLRYFNVDREIKTVLVTSAAPGDGKSTVTWNLARSAAEAGLHAIFVEADFHRPVVAERYDLEPLPGLSDVLTEQSALPRTIKSIAMEESASVDGRLDVIPSGGVPPNPAELLGSDGMRRLLERLRADYDLVLIDTPPLPVIADAIPVTRLADGVLVVAQAGKTTREDAGHLSFQLGELSAQALGVVVNRTKTSSATYDYAPASDR